MIRLLSLLFLSLALCQCSTIQRNVTPITHPESGEVVVFGIKGQGNTVARPSQFLAALENIQAEVSSDNEAHRGYEALLGIQDPKIQKTGLNIGGPQFETETKDGQKIAVLLPLVTVMSVGLPPENIRTAMPKIQSYCYRVISHHMRPIRKSELKPAPKKA